MPIKVVYNAVPMPDAIVDIAFCNVEVLDTSIAPKTDTNIIRKPATVPNIPNDKHNSAMNQLTGTILFNGRYVI